MLSYDNEGMSSKQSYEHVLSRITEPKYIRLFPLPVNDISDGRSIPCISSTNPTLHYHYIVVFEGILLTHFPVTVTNE